MAKFQAPPRAILCVVLATISQFHFTFPNPIGFSIKLIPRDSPESPLYPGNLTQVERMQRLMAFSEGRGYYLENFIHQNATLAGPENIQFKLLRDNFLYLAQVVIGSQGTLFNLLLDTGSGLIWTQCQPCKNCYPQLPRFPIYSSQSSTSYRKLTCDSPLCSGDHAVYKCVNDECVYGYRYGGGETTRGVASLETFRFFVGGTSTTTIDGIVFGCSNDNQNMPFAKNGVISGVLGLSLCPDSMISQLYQSLGQRFSYCLIPFTEALQAPGLLKFGDDIPKPSGHVLTTKFATPSELYLYFLKLLDISVAGTRIGFAPEIFKLRQDGKGGCIIDSGTLIPRIDEETVGRNAYRAVMGAFQKFYDSKRLQRVMGEVPEGFRLCYRLYPGFRDFAAMTYHFEDADYAIDGQYVNYFNNEKGYFCVGLVAGQGRTVLGAWHQQNMRIIYDGNIGGIQFAPENCANDRP